MKSKLIPMLFAALAAGPAAAATTLSFTATDAILAVSGAGSFESVIKIAPTTSNALKMSFSSVDGSFSSVKYSFYTNPQLTLTTGLASYSVWVNGAGANPANTFSTTSELVPFVDAEKASINLVASTPYYLNISGVLNDADGHGAFKVTVANGLVAAVPEPESYAMLLAGLGVMGAIARRRNKAWTN